MTVTAPVSGVIDRLYVGYGYSVQPGDVIMTIRSVKTYVDVRAGYSGYISSLGSPGESVNASDVVAVISSS
ncbi:hypothetical protein GQ42DRAFT_162061 [Ramicandelaber brevisporus]|nr:hypothetical protein GQ42DRAFT_162061 [Ramicandelaber brevisporus]